MKIYVDMDGVLSDLDGSLAVWGGVSLNFVRSNLDYRESLIRNRVSQRKQGTRLRYSLPTALGILSRLVLFPTKESAIG